MTRHFTICVHNLKSVVKNLNKKYMKLLQKFHDETHYDLCSLSKIGSEEFEYKIHEIIAEIP